MRLNLIEEQACSVLKRFESRLGKKIDRPPIPVHSIASVCYGLGVNEKQIDADGSGELFLRGKTTSGL